MIKLKLSKKKINKSKKTKLLRKRNLRKSLKGGVNKTVVPNQYVEFQQTTNHISPETRRLANKVKTPVNITNPFHPVYNDPFRNPSKPASHSKIFDPSTFNDPDRNSFYTNISTARYTNIAKPFNNRPVYETYLPLENSIRNQNQRNLLLENRKNSNLYVPVPPHRQSPTPPPRKKK